MKHLSTFLILLTFITGAYSQQSSNPLIDQGSEVVIDRLPENDFYYTHVFQKGQTIYSLARTFRTSVSEIYAMNNLSANTPIDIGQTVKVPFDVKSLYTEGSTSLQTSNKYVPVYYEAQPKETLYGIGKTYFDQDVATFAKRNKLNGTSIAIGQKLLIGWLPLSGEGNAVKVNTTVIKADKAEKEPKLITRENTSVTEIAPKEGRRREKFVTTIVTPESINESEKDITVPNPDDIKEEIATASEEISDTLATMLEEPLEEIIPTTRKRQTRGIGIWERDSKVGSMAFVLHHTAKKGSMIELYNPQLNRRTTAKVLGRIPLGTYPSDVSVIMSKKVADSLGALDTRIMVELTFVEEIN